VEALTRGMKAELLQAEDYSKLKQCDALSDLRLYLVSKCYKDVLQNELDVVDPTDLVKLCTETFVLNFKQLVSMASEPLTTILDYIKYGFMIDNVVLIMAGAVCGRSLVGLKENFHPLGLFDSIENLLVANDLKEIHRLVLVDTPISHYFNACLRSDNLDESRIEFIRNSAHKVYLEDFIDTCTRLQDGSKSVSALLELLYFEADRRVMNIAVASLGTEMSASDKINLFPKHGHLFPNVHISLASCTTIDKIQAVLRSSASLCGYVGRLSTVDIDVFDKVLYEEEQKLCESVFTRDSGYAIFMAYTKLYEQELRNILWVAECLVQHQKGRFHEGLVYAGCES